MKVKISSPGKKTITFTHTPADEPIPAEKKAAALAGKYGAKARKQALFAKNVLTGGK
jgi:hypothetical protein